MLKIIWDLIYIKLGNCTFCPESWHLVEDRDVVAQRKTPSGERLAAIQIEVRRN